MSESSIVIPTQPQTDKALGIIDPSIIDDTAIYHYSQQDGQFDLTSYKVYIQDPLDLTSPLLFPSLSNGKLVPTSSSFILEINGSGFDISTQVTEPLKIYIKLVGQDGYTYIANIPPLSSATDLTTGNSFGYKIKSTSVLWLYFARLLFQQIWLKIDNLNLYSGEETNKKIQLESGISNPIPVTPTSFTLFVAINKDISFKTNYFSQEVNQFKTIDNITMSLSPFIITLQGNNVNNTIQPIFIKNNNDIARSIYAYGYNIENQKILVTKASSTILAKYPSVLPKYILDANQDEQTIKNINIAELKALEFFKTGYFLSDLLLLESQSTLENYIYRAADGTFKRNGETNRLPQENLESVQFSIRALPLGLYNVIIYDGLSGDYDVAPVKLTIDSSTVNLQIHNIIPQVAILHNPSFTVNGFNFPVLSDIENGAVFTVNLIAKSSPILSSPMTFLQIDSSSKSIAKNGNGTITLISDVQFKVDFTNLHLTDLDIGELKTFSLFIEVLYPSINSSAPNKISASVLSDPINIQKQPIIHFLTNTAAISSLPSYEKSLVHIDKITGKVIAFGDIEDYLYVVGENFNTGNKKNVLINGIQQTVVESIAWPQDPSLNALKVLVDPSNINGDASVEVKIDDASSEAFVFAISIQSENTTFNASGLRTSGAQVKNNDLIFSAVLPYNQFDQTKLLNSSHTRVSCSIALELANTITKETVKLTADLNTSVALLFYPNQITIPDNTPLLSSGDLDIIFYFYNLYNVNISTPKIFRLQHDDGSFNGTFKANEKMTVVGSGFVNGMRYNINKTDWTVVDSLSPLLVDKTILQTFTIIVPASTGSSDASLQVSSEQAQRVHNIASAGKSNGGFKVNINIVNDKYSPLLKINQRLPAGIKMYAKGTQNTMTDILDANMSVYSQITPFLSSFKIILIVIRVVVCIIDVICALINPFKLIIAIIALMDCIIDLLSLFPQLAIPIMILSFLQNFVGFLLTFVTQLESYVFAVVNSQLALVKSQISQDFAQLAAAEQQAFGATKQIRDVVALLEPALQIVQIFRDLLNFAMHFPCASNQGGTQNDGTCPPGNMQKLIQEVVQDKQVAPNTYIINGGNLIRDKNIVTGITSIPNQLLVGEQISLSQSAIDKFQSGEDKFPAGIKTITNIIDSHTFTYNEQLPDAISTIATTIDTIVSEDQQATLATMFCQAVAMQTATLQTMPGFNAVPGSTSIIPLITPTLPNISAAIECMNSYTDQLESALNNGKVVITNSEQGNNLVNAYLQCIQTLIDQTKQSLGDICILAVSALNSELKISPKGNIGPNSNDDFIKTKLALPSTNPNNSQDTGLVLDLAKFSTPFNIPSSITKNIAIGSDTYFDNFGIKPDISDPIIFQSKNKSGKRQSLNTIYFNADNSDVGSLISIGDTLEIVGGAFNGLQFPITEIQTIFTAIRLTCKLDITFEQKVEIGEREFPLNLSGFDVKIIANLSGNDGVAVVPADGVNFATIQVLARDHHGHLIGPGLADKVSVNILSGTAEFIPIIPSQSTDVTGVIQENNDFYICNIKSNCSGIVIISASICNIKIQDIGYHSSDPKHAIVTRDKTIKILFTPPLPQILSNTITNTDKPQEPGTNFIN